MFGTGNLHTWAKNIDEIHQRFTDIRKIDRKKFMDDSAYRCVALAAELELSGIELGYSDFFSETYSSTYSFAQV